MTGTLRIRMDGTLIQEYAHSDRGSQYCSHEYRKILEKCDFQGSMSKRGDCYDNAPIESFWGILKNELVHHCNY